MMKIMKASAGSGKTYNLSRTYIDMLLSQEDIHAYRHILAVTFTNKATAEMKARILKDLSSVAETDGRARTILREMLHDYSAFAVSTIDRFFQQTLRAFAREIGQFADYQVELDRVSLIREAMDRILDSLSEDQTELVAWLKRSVSEAIENGSRVRLEESLYDMGRRLKSSEFSNMVSGYVRDAGREFSKERLADVHKVCTGIILDFFGRARDLGKLEGTLKEGKVISNPAVKIDWPKAGETRNNEALAELFDREYAVYLTAFYIDANIYYLGLAGEFLRQFDALMKEKNVICIDDSNSILKDIIDGSDAPFVYEKIGVRYDHYLLDEFQDTSGIQWANFLPLLKESDARANDNLIVGDVKQSIYRWRDSDWRLLGGEAAREFPGAECVTLGGNWRSTEEVVRFNNSFFTFASGFLGKQDIYSDVAQQHCEPEDMQPGYVGVKFVDSDVQTMEAVTACVAGARAAGAAWHDIAVLVRGNSEGARVALALIAEGIPVISDDSLMISSSAVVSRLLALLRCIENPEDGISAYLVRKMRISFPSNYHSLVDLCESLLRSIKDFDAGSFDSEVAFIQAFMDELQAWTAAHGNSLGEFLKYWDGQDRAISSPENADSVRVMTVHKSKGLEFPCVIFPFAEKVVFYKNDVHWCRLPADKAPDSRLEGIYPVNLTSESAGSLFAPCYEAERDMQIVDNLNIFYVALTRAGKSLHIISRTPSKNLKESIDKGRDRKEAYGNFGQLLYKYLVDRQHSKSEFGQAYDFSLMPRRNRGDAAPEVLAASYPSVETGQRLALSTDAAEFFGPDGTVGLQASSRLRGIVLHDILSDVYVPGDLPDAVRGAVLDGRLDAADAAGAEELLARRIAAHPEWFTAECSEIRNEAAAFDADGTHLRPDRVIISSDGRSATVIDFKFGRFESKYETQILSYCSLYRKLGYDISGSYLWFVADDKVIEIIDKI